MSEKRASLILDLKDLASAGVDQLKQKISGLSASTVSLAIEFTALAAEIYKSVTAFAEQEAAVARLTQGLKNTSTDAKAAAGRLSDLAESLSRTTGFTNTTIASFQGLLANMGFNEAAIAQMTPRVLDMSRAFGVDASTAAMMLGKSIETGSTMSLRRMGLVVDEAAFKVGDFGKIMQEVDGKVKGSAVTFGNTTAGAIAKLKAAFEELQERVGQVLAAALMPLVQVLMQGFAVMQQMTPAITIFTSGLSVAGTTIAATAQALGSMAGVMALVFERDWKGAAAAAKQGMADWGTTMMSGLDAAGKRIEGAWDKIKGNLAGGGDQPKGTSGPVPGGKPNTPGLPLFASEDEFQIKLAQMQGFHQKAEQLVLQHQMRLARTEQDQGRVRILQEAMLNRQRLDTTTQIFSNLAVLQSSKNKELAAVGKAAATGEAIMRGALAVQQALSAFPGPPWTFALAASVGVMTAANVAKIQGVEFAEGGMAMPTAGGVPGIFAEAGKPEAVIPLDDPATKAKLRDTFGGGTGPGGHVTIQIGNLIADQSGLEEFARTLDKVFWRLKKNGQTVAI